MLDGFAQTKDYLDTLPTEQAEAALVAISVLTLGPTKTILDAGKSTVADTVIGDTLKELNTGIAKHVVAGLKGNG